MELHPDPKAPVGSLSCCQECAARECSDVATYSQRRGTWNKYAQSTSICDSYYPGHNSTSFSRIIHELLYSRICCVAYEQSKGIIPRHTTTQQHDFKHKCISSPVVIPQYIHLSQTYLPNSDAGSLHGFRKHRTSFSRYKCIPWSS